MTILVDRRDSIAIITLNRPQALNALNLELMEEICTTAEALDADAAIRAIVITGNDRAFAAGADITEMEHLSGTDAWLRDWFAGWDRLARVRTPLIAAVNGYALGGGCELAMICDFIIAGDTAKFGQPEVNLGISPGIGGSQRLTRAIGKAKAMDLCLTGRFIGAEEAERAGLVARVVPAVETLGTAIDAAETIAAKPPIAAQQIKEQINAAFETTLSQGLLFERRTCHALFNTHDKAEGMAAFRDKRDAHFQGL